MFLQASTTMATTSLTSCAQQVKIVHLQKTEKSSILCFGGHWYMLKPSALITFRFLIRSQNFNNTYYLSISWSRFVSKSKHHMGVWNSPTHMLEHNAKLCSATKCQLISEREANSILTLPQKYLGTSREDFVISLLLHSKNSGQLSATMFIRFRPTILSNQRISLSMSKAES